MRLIPTKHCKRLQGVKKGHSISAGLFPCHTACRPGCRGSCHQDPDQGPVPALQDEFHDPFKARQSKDFRSNYLELWHRLIRAAKEDDLLFDEFMLDKVSTLLLALNW